MTSLWLRRIMVAISVLGIALAAYLTYVHYSGTPPACTAGQSCLRVQTSIWSKLDGIPVALIGLIGYVFIFGTLVAPDRDESRLATLGLTLVGFGFSAYLTYREIYSIHAICEECATSAVFLTLLFIGAGTRYVLGPGRPAPYAPAGGDAESSVARAQAPAAPGRKRPTSAKVSADG